MSPALGEPPVDCRTLICGFDNFYTISIFRRQPPVSLPATPHGQRRSACGPDGPGPMAMRLGAIEAWNVRVGPPLDASARSVTEHLICSRATGTDPAARLDELDGLTRRVARNRRVILCDVLISTIVDSPGGVRFPATHPLPADLAVAVLDRRRARVGHGRSGIGEDNPAGPVRIEAGHAHHFATILSAMLTRGICPLPKVTGLTAGCSDLSQNLTIEARRSAYCRARPSDNTIIAIG